MGLRWICYECQGVFERRAMSFDGALGFCSSRCWVNYHNRGVS